MDFKPEIIEAVAESLENKASIYRAVGWLFLAAGLIFGAALFANSTAQFPVDRNRIDQLAGIGLMVGGAVIFATCLSAAARMRLQAQLFRMALAVEENTRRSAEALEEFISLSR